VPLRRFVLFAGVGGDLWRSPEGDILFAGWRRFQSKDPERLV
jgi:hypothetical protein